MPLNQSPDTVIPVPDLGRSKLRAAEFFAGIGLVRCGLEQAGIEVVWANDIEPVKKSVYAANFDDSHFLLGDIREVAGETVPTVDLATASFPCVDLSLAGNRRGLRGEQSGLFYEFARILGEMGDRSPSVVMVENVASFVSSRDGRDLRAAVRELNALGYVCDLLMLDARWFTPQSRPRLFIVGARQRYSDGAASNASLLRPDRLVRFCRSNPDLELQELPLATPRCRGSALSDAIERFAPASDFWWNGARYDGFMSSLVPLQRRRLESLRARRRFEWRTAYRRTRAGVAVWEIRGDELAGCLRTARGGSSRQAVVQAGHGRVQVRWMTPREYARLQGVPEDFDFSTVSEAQALFGFGDAVCVPVIAWLAREALTPAATGSISTDAAA
ncbi:MAG: DNA (cytosine-5-)-methyltransferase [Acidimicrobiaceae bacterium]|nr:DNA (cytosine-5-)-methyltransferase [Acidimicrobiaceae bacterium]